MKDFKIEDGTLVRYLGEGGAVTIPESVDRIEEDAFANCRRMTSVTIPGSVKTICSRAFLNCTGLTAITLPEGLRDIGRSVFEHCTGLTSVTIPESLTSIPELTFKGCTALTSVTLPDSLTEIDGCAFCACLNLKDIKLPPALQHLGENAFALTPWYEALQKAGSLVISGGYLFDARHCTGKVEIPDGVTLIASHAFTTPLITAVTVPGSVRYINDVAFYKCWNLTALTIEEGVTHIGEEAFSCCTGLTSVTLPDSVTHIGDGAFSYCVGLTSVTLSKGMTSITEEMFSDCAALTDLTIPGTIRKIERSAFEFCTALTAFTAPEGMTCIEENAFRSCSALTSVTLPASMTELNAWAFTDCEKIRMIRVRGIELHHKEIDYLKWESATDPRYFLYLLVSYDMVKVEDAPPDDPIILTAFKACPDDERTIACIRSHFSSMLSWIFEEDELDLELLRLMMNSGKFNDNFRGCIDDLIEYAIDEELHELQLLLMNYKHEQLGFPDITDRFEL
ncbi:MAG: leucine-rich repeat domain-containing protein [Oscillospiraceae bacterium]|nr:leucine-rich repeat domain-containing protein [Oscillospiraceae bacterium]